MAKKKNIPPKKPAKKKQNANPNKDIKAISDKEKSTVNKPTKPKKKAKLGRPKKRGRKKTYRNPVKKKTNRKRSNTNKQYWKVYYRLQKYYRDKSEAAQAAGKPFTMPSAEQLRKYTTKLYSEFKSDSEKSGKKFNISAKTLDSFFTKEKLESFISRIGVGLPIEPFPFWYLEAELDKLPPDIIIEISTDDILREFGGETIRTNNSQIQSLDIINNINNFVSENIDKYPDKYLWFIVEITDDGYYIELIFSADLDAGFKGQKADKLPPKEKPPTPPTLPTEMPEEPSPEKQQKDKAEADKAIEEAREAKAKADTAEIIKAEKEIKKINVSIKALLEELAAYQKMKMDDMVKETMAEIKRLNEKRKKLNE